eukprot:SAG11_NODE_166_length_13763_cov_8.292722_4_plen_140_part_00
MTSHTHPAHFMAREQERQEEEIGAESIWDSEYRGVARAFPSAPRTELELARPPIWSSDPANGAVPEFAEAPIDEDVLASGDGSSSLRRVPADKAFQLKGASQNTPFRPGGFEKKSTGANPAVAYGMQHVHYACALLLLT